MSAGIASLSAGAAAQAQTPPAAPTERPAEMHVEPFGGPPPAAAPAPAPEAQEATDEGRHAEDDRRRTGKWILVGVGAGLLAVGHLSAAGIAAANDFGNEGHWLVAPVIGPWLYLGEREGCSDEEDSIAGDISSGLCGLGNGLLVTAVFIDGLMQLGGAAAMTIGLAMPAREPVDGWGALRPTILPVHGGGLAPGVTGSF